MKPDLRILCLLGLVGLGLMEPRAGLSPGNELAAGEPAARAVLLGRKLDLRRASSADLEALPGIGPARARAIVAEIQRRGASARLADLADAPGLGPATVERLRPYVTLE